MLMMDKIDKIEPKLIFSSKIKWRTWGLATTALLNFACQRITRALHIYVPKGRRGGSAITIFLLHLFLSRCFCPPPFGVASFHIISQSQSFSISRASSENSHKVADVAFVIFCRIIIIRRKKWIECILLLKL